MSHQKRNPVFKPAEEEGSVHIDPPLRAADEILAVDPPGHEEDVSAVSSAQVKPENTWKEITPEQQTGVCYLVVNDLDDNPVLAYWKKTRVMSHFRWVLNGKWCDVLTNRYLIPQPIYYMEPGEIKGNV